MSKPFLSPYQKMASGTPGPPGALVMQPVEMGQKGPAGAGAARHSLQETRSVPGLAQKVLGALGLPQETFWSIVNVQVLGHVHQVDALFFIFF